MKSSKIVFRNAGKMKLLSLLSISLLILSAGAGYVIAYGTTNPPVLGHSRFGIGVSAAELTDTLTVDGPIRIIPRSSASCNSGHNGAIYYDSDDNYVYICRNGAWVRYQGPTGPTGPAGLQGPSGPAAPTISGVCTNAPDPYHAGVCNCPGSTTLLVRNTAPCQIRTPSGNCGVGCWVPGGACGSCCVCKS
jgi:hypothetical protein